MKPPAGTSPEAVAKEFLAALDAERWTEAASWLHPETAEAFRAWRRSAGADAEALTDAEVFARYAEALAPGRCAGGAPFRLRRIVVDVEETASCVNARYRTEVLLGAMQLTHFPWWNDVRELPLARARDGWRVLDVSLAPDRGGSLLPPDARKELVRRLRGR